jgi:putative PIN family toxin of toxin-antitoxin system
VRVVLDANVIISALLSHAGPSARLIDRWRAGELDIVLCPRLIAEVEKTVRRRRIRARLDADEAAIFVSELRKLANVVADATEPPRVRSADPDDDYLVALAARERVHLISGDAHLLALADRIPVRSPREFLDELE